MGTQLIAKDMNMPHQQWLNCQPLVMQVSTLEHKQRPHLTSSVGNILQIHSCTSTLNRSTNIPASMYPSQQRLVS